MLFTKNVMKLLRELLHALIQRMLTVILETVYMRNMETKNFGLTETDFLQLFVEYNSRNPNYRHILRTDSTTNKMKNNKINRIPIPDTLIFGEANSIYNVKYYKYTSTIEKLFLFLGQVIRYDPYLNLFVIVT